MLRNATLTVTKQQGTPQRYGVQIQQSSNTPSVEHYSIVNSVRMTAQLQLFIGDTDPEIFFSLITVQV
jgi:hypothetical protein